MSYSQFFARTLSMAGLIAMLTLSIPAAAFSNPFPDVPTNHTFAPFIYNLRDYNVVSGFGDGKFYPDQMVTRGQMSKFVKNGIFGANYSNTSCSDFVDVSTNNTFYSEIKTLKCEGVISGFADNSFKPNDSVTRGQAMKFVIAGVRTKLNDPQFLTIKEAEIHSFKDVSKSNPFYDYILSAYSNYVVGGYNDGTFKPNDPVSRGAMSKMVWNVMLTTNFKVQTIAPANATSFEVTRAELNPCMSNDSFIGGMHYGVFDEASNKSYGMQVINKNFVMSTQSKTDVANSINLINGSQDFPNFSNQDIPSKNAILPINEGRSCGDDFIGIWIKDQAVSYPESDYVRGVEFVTSGGGSAYPVVGVSVYALKGDNLISMFSYVPKIEPTMESYAAQCAGTNSKQELECIRQKVSSDSTIQTKVETVATDMITTFAL